MKTLAIIIIIILVFVGWAWLLISEENHQIDRCKKLGGEYFHVYGGGNCVIPNK